MSGQITNRVARVLLAVIAVTAFVEFAAAQTMSEYSAEARFQLDLHVPDAVLAGFLPKGWSPNIATQGAAKDANLRAVRRSWASGENSDRSKAVAPEFAQGWNFRYPRRGVSQATTVGAVYSLRLRAIALARGGPRLQFQKKYFSAN